MLEGVGALIGEEAGPLIFGGGVISPSKGTSRAGNMEGADLHRSIVIVHG